MKLKLSTPLVLVGALLVTQSTLYAQDQLSTTPQDPESAVTKQCNSHEKQAGGCANNPQTCVGQDCTMQTWDASKCDGFFVNPLCKVELKDTTVTIRTGNCTVSGSGCACSGTDETVTVKKSRC